MRPTTSTVSVAGTDDEAALAICNAFLGHPRVLSNEAGLFWLNGERIPSPINSWAHFDSRIVNIGRERITRALSRQVWRLVRAAGRAKSKATAGEGGRQ